MPKAVLAIILAVSLFTGLGIGSAKANDEFRNSIRIVGSSTVFPFAAFVAERFHRQSKYKSPVVESTGSGGGIKMFCAGIGVDYPDIVNASRAMKPSEVALCQKNKVTDIAEIMIGYDGIAVTQARRDTPLRLTRYHLWRALAAKVIIDGKEVDNPFSYWDDVDASLPHRKIMVYGPPPTSGTRDVFVELALSVGCQSERFYQDMDDAARKTACGKIREDGAYIDAGEDDELLVRKVSNDLDAIGVVGYNVVKRRSNLVEAAWIDSIQPDFDSIVEGRYALSRPLYLYVKVGHLGAVPGLKEYLREFTAIKTIGFEGYLVDKGLIPLDEATEKSVVTKVLSLKPLSFK